jgi:hypothetical protein
MATTSGDMGRRRRGQRQKSWEDQRAEARLELERAESALKYRRSQFSEAEAELKSLEGPSGWFAAVLGKRAVYRAEIQGRMKALHAEVVASRTRLIEARKALASFDREAAKRDAKTRQRDDELEQFAMRIRESGMHYLKDKLAEIEDEIEDHAQRLAQLDDAIEAAATLNGTLKAFVNRGANTQRVSGDVPALMERFNAACESLDLPPLNIDVPDIGMPWEQFLATGVLADLHYEERLVRFKRRVQDESQMVVDTMMHLSSLRKPLFEAQEKRLARRRAFLDESLG